MNILGIACFTHHAAACLLRGGTLVAAAQEERFTRVPGTGAVPLNAINHCIQTAGITFSDLDGVAFFEKPYLRFYRELIGHLRAFPQSYPAFLREMPRWLQDRLILPLVLEREIGYTGPVRFIKHHLAHAASAFFTAPHARAAVLVADGAGEWAALSYGVADERGITMLREQYYPDSLGLLYSAVTAHLGFAPQLDEGTVEALSASGAPRYLAEMRSLISVREDGSFRLARRAFHPRRLTRPGRAQFTALVGPPRAPGQPLEQAQRDLAASLQTVLEETLVNIARQVRQDTDCDTVCVAGGVMHNARAVQRLAEADVFAEVYVPPAPGVAGGALGAALAAHVLVHGQTRPAALVHAAYGAQFTPAACRRALLNAGLPCDEYADDALAHAVADAVAGGGVVAWFNGPDAFSADAQGWRVLLGDVRHAGVCERLRQGAGVCEVIVRADAAAAWFERVHGTGVAMSMPHACVRARQAIAAALAPDGRARVLAITAGSHPLLWQVLTAVEEQTGMPLVASAPLRAADGIIVCQPEEAVQAYAAGGADALALGPCFVRHTYERVPCDA
jgi:carbamoyltransferase